MHTKDINGADLARGDSVMPEQPAFVIDSTLPREVGTIFHIFVDGREKGIHIRFGEQTYIASTGYLLRKVTA